MGNQTNENSSVIGQVKKHLKKLHELRESY